MSNILPKTLNIFEYKAVVFDLDNTLITHVGDTSAFVFEAFTSALHLLPNNIQDSLSSSTHEELNGKLLNAKRQAFEHVDALIQQENLQIHQFGILLWFKFFEVLNIRHTAELIDHMYTNFFNLYAKSIELTPGSLELLQRLQSQGITVGILSNGSYHERVKKLKNSNILNFVDVLISTDLAKGDKPHSHSYELIHSYLPYKHKEILMIGDKPLHDFEGAKKHGFDAILYDPKDRYPEVSPRVKCLTELLG